MTQRAPLYAGVPARGRSIDLLTWIETLPPGKIGDVPPRPIRDRDIRNPLPLPPNLQLRTWTNGLPPGVIAQTPPRPIRNRDWPNPTLRVPNLELRTWIETTLPIASAALPRNQRDWPNPTLPRPNFDLRTWVDTLPFPALQVPPGQHDWPNPLPGSPNLELRTWTLQNAAITPVPVVPPVVTTPPVEDQPSGGWRFWVEYEREIERRKAAQRRRRKPEEEAEQIEDAVDREIAQLLREQEAKDERRAELERLREIAKAEANAERIRELGDRLAKAYERAITQATFSAAEALDRELKRAQEEEEFLLLAAMHILGMH